MKAGTRPRPRALRRRRPSILARVRPFWIVALLLAIAGAAGGTELVRAPFFRVAHVGVDLPIGAPVSRADVLRAAAIAPDANVWLLATGAIARRVAAIPYVASAEVRRAQFPQPAATIAVTIRRPSACVATARGLVTIDASARVLQRGCTAAPLPRIVAATAAIPPPGDTIADPAIGGLLTDARILADAGLTPRSLGRDRWGGLEAVDASGVTLRFGEDDDLARKAALIAPVRAGIGTAHPIRAIDVRSPATPTVEFR